MLWKSLIRSNATGSTTMLEDGFCGFCGQSSWKKHCGAGKADVHLEYIYSSEDKSLLPPRCKRFSVVTSVISVARLWLTLCNLMDCSMPGFPVHYQLPELAQTHVHWVRDAIQTSHPLSSPFFLLPSILLSIRVFSNESVLHIRWPKYWSFSIISSNEYSGLISFRIDWFDLFAIQGTLKSLQQHHSSKAKILWCLAFFMVQLSHYR